MADVQFIIRDNVDDFIDSLEDLKQKSSEANKNVRGIAEAWDAVGNVTKESIQKQKDLIRELEGEAKKLQKAYDKMAPGKQSQQGLKELRDMQLYVREEQVRLGLITDKYRHQQEELAKSTNALTTGFKNLGKRLAPLALTMGLILKTIKDVTSAFKDTVLGMNAITYVSEMWKQMSYNIATARFNLFDFNQTMHVAMLTASKVNDLRIKERKALVDVAKIQREYQKSYFETFSLRGNDAERLEKINKTLELNAKAIERQNEVLHEQLKIVRLQLIARPKSNKLLDEEAKLLAQIENIQATAYSSTKRLESQRAMLEEKVRDDMFKEYFEWIEKRNKMIDASNEILEKFYESELGIMIDHYDKTKAERDMQLRELRKWKDDLLFILGDLTPEQYAMLDKMAGNIQLEFLKSVSVIDRADVKKVGVSMKNWMDIILPEMQKIPEGILEYRGTYPGQKTFKDWFWDIFNIAPETEKGQEMIAALRDTGDVIVGIFEDIYDARVYDAQRTRQIYDQRISEQQRAIDLEAQLVEDGYANNLSAQQEYLVELQRQRDEALKEEEKAIEKQRKLNAVLQTTNLITASAEIIKNSLKTNPVLGLILASSAIAGMFAIFSSAKKQAAKTILATGGSGTDTGIIKGKRHAQGGEQFLRHVEVERGEAWGVLSRQATRQYGDIFHDMVSSFNRGELPAIAAPNVSNKVIVDNKGPNTRLDRVIKEQKALNKSMSDQSFNVGSKRYIVKGNKTRIIG